MADSRAQLPDPPPAPERATVGLVETMRADGGHVALLHRHLDRLGRAARIWHRPFDADGLRGDIARALVGAPPLARVRLVLGARGADVSVAPLAAAAFGTAAVYPEPMPEAGGWRCAFKTTARGHYDRALAWARAVGVDEPLLLNARGEIAEGARTNVWLREGDAWVTPPLSSGGLGGVARAAWLAEPAACECVITPSRLAAADGVWLSNAVRGRMPVRLAEPGTDGLGAEAPGPDGPGRSEGGL